MDSTLGFGQLPLGQHSRMDALLHDNRVDEMLRRNAPAVKAPCVIPHHPLNQGASTRGRKGHSPRFFLPSGLQNQGRKSRGQHQAAPVLLHLQLWEEAQALRHAACFPHGLPTCHNTL